MHPHRRRVVTVFAASAAALAAWAKSAAAAPSRRVQDAVQSGLRPGSPEDQSRLLQSSLDECARTHTPLVLPAGVYRASNLKLPARAQVSGTRGSTTIMLSQAGASLISGIGSDHITLSGLIFDGAHKPLPDRKGLAQLEALVAIGCGGEFVDSTFMNIAEVAIHVFDSSGFLIARNHIAGAGNGGIQVWRSRAGDDGTMVIDNLIERIENRLGGSGQYGNAINVFRAGNVSVRGLRILRGARQCGVQSAYRG